MEFLGVGPTELLFVIVIALIVLGPKDLAKTGKTIGKWLNNIVHSETWTAIRKTSDELRQLPTQLMREDNYERAQVEKEKAPPSQVKAGTWSGSERKEEAAPVPDEENRIHPPITVDGPPASELNSKAKPIAEESDPSANAQGEDTNA